MRKILIGILIAMFSFSALADDECYRNLSDNYSQDSRHFKILIDDFEYSDEADLEKEALKYLLKGMKCSIDKLQNFKCQHVSQFEYSYVCSANIQEGFFFISADYVNSVNIIFNRFD